MDIGRPNLCQAIYISSCIQCLEQSPKSNLINVMAQFVWRINQAVQTLKSSTNTFTLTLMAMSTELCPAALGQKSALSFYQSQNPSYCIQLKAKWSKDCVFRQKWQARITELYLFGMTFKIYIYELKTLSVWLAQT